MKKDNFNVQLLHYIENAKDVFIILEEGYLSACKSEEWNKKWFCKEVAHAIETKRNIIPILSWRLSNLKNVGCANYRKSAVTS